MAEVNPPLNLQARSDHTAVGDRQLLDSIYVYGGIAQRAHLGVTQNGTPNMSVNVAAGKVVVIGTENALQGAYHCWNDATKNVVIAPSDPTNPRIDLIVARVRDAAYSGVTNAWAIEAVTGAPAASPAAPATPANSYVIARVAVAASATSITNAVITDLRQLARPWGAAWGTISETQRVSNYAIPAAGPWDIPGMVCANVPTLNGRRYRVNAHMWLISGAAQIITIEVWNPSSRLGFAKASFSSSAQEHTPQISVPWAPGAATTSINLRSITSTGTATLGAASSYPAYISVDDMGPV